MQLLSKPVETTIDLQRPSIYNPRHVSVFIWIFPNTNDIKRSK